MDKQKKLLTAELTIVSLMIIKIIAFYLMVGINPVSGLLGIFTIAILLCVFYALIMGKTTKSTVVFAVIYTFITFWMFADTVYYGYFNEFTSVNQLWQMNNLVVVNDSFKFVMPPISIVFFLDIPFVVYIFQKIRKTKIIQVNKRKGVVLMSIAFVLPLILAILPININMVTRNQKTEFFTYHFKDAIDNLFLVGKPKEKSAKETVAIIDECVGKTLDNEYFGISKDKNLIVIQIESFQNFVIGKEYNGQELTPNLNKLINKDSIYFKNYFQTIGKGNTADAEFASQNSIYPVIKGESYRLFVNNTFSGLPWIMRDLGYETTVFHGYEENFWNRKNAYVNQGFQDFISQEDFDDTETIGFGLSDKEMFRQTADILKNKKSPFYSFIITLTNHHPYELPEDKKVIKLKPEDEGTVFGNYMQSVYYTDVAIGQFIESLKENGVYDECIFVLYGDHHGLNCKDKDISESMNEFLGYDYTFRDMLNVPLIIHMPGSEVTKRIDTVGGQVDLMPTIANLMGADISGNESVFGQDLNNASEGFVASLTYMLEGSFINDEVIFEYARDGIFEHSKAFDLNTHKEVDIKGYLDESIRAKKLLQTSEYILELNLIKKLKR
ncbi:MAG: hypothetical protein K0R15_1246 [Clostridiales bacterium]|jgi:phosphoglycerol transferase MdoB-like AlkP superfamily enzyme|nr:hypothetical protein [Clostridiales bacterium]